MKDFRLINAMLFGGCVWLFIASSSLHLVQRNVLWKTWFKLLCKKRLINARLLCCCLFTQLRGFDMAKQPFENLTFTCYRIFQSYCCLPAFIFSCLTMIQVKINIFLLFLTLYHFRWWPPFYPFKEAKLSFNEHQMATFFVNTVDSQFSVYLSCW